MISKGRLEPLGSLAMLARGEASYHVTSLSWDHQTREATMLNKPNADVPVERLSSSLPKNVSEVVFNPLDHLFHLSAEHL